MSGGSLGYFYSRLNDHVGDLGDKELDSLVKDLVELFHDREWYLSGDTGEGDWRESRDRFKEKWFTKHGRDERIEQYLQDLGDEIRETLGMNQKYCMDCKHWTARGGDSHFGKCDYKKTCLTHRSDRCDKYVGSEAK